MKPPLRCAGPPRCPPRPAAARMALAPAERPAGRSRARGRRCRAPRHGAVVIAAITSCTNTSNPSVMLAAGLLAKKAVERGLRVPAYVKTSLAPGSRVVTEYLAGGRPAALPRRSWASIWSATAAPPASATPARCRRAVAKAVQENDLVAAAVLSGNRNFEGRVHPLDARQLPGLAAAGGGLRSGRHGATSTCASEPLGPTRKGSRSSCATSGRREEEIDAMAAGPDPPRCSATHLRRRVRRQRGSGTPSRSAEGELYAWERNVHLHPGAALLRGLDAQAGRRSSRSRARACWPSFGDSITTDHISPGRRHSRKAGRPGSICASTACSKARLQLLRRAPRQPRGDDARHIRQHPPQEPALPGAEGGVHAPLPGRRPHDASTTRPCATRRKACRWWSSPARNTAPARRATGPPKGRCCWACGP